jgi:hypothetical protein
VGRVLSSRRVESCGLLIYEKIMGIYNFIRSDSDQVFLLPPDMRDWLPEGHLAWEIIKVVDTLDLSAFLASYRADGQGRPAYHPTVMVTLVAYCYCKGIRSSRAIEGACFDDLGCLPGDLWQPSGRPRHDRPVRQAARRGAAAAVCAGAGGVRPGRAGAGRPGRRRRHQGQGQRLQGHQPHRRAAGRADPGAGGGAGRRGRRLVCAGRRRRRRRGCPVRR